MSSSAAAPAVVRRPSSVAATLLLTVLALLGSLLVAPSASAEVHSEWDFANRVNAERAARGLPALRLVTDLSDIARGHSNRMAAENRLYHNPSLTSQVRGWYRVAENVGYGPEVGEIHSALMNSTGHRANILDGVVTQMGIGTAWSSGRLWVTQVFRKPDGTTVSVPSVPAPAPAPAPPPPPPTPVDLGLAACPAGLPVGTFADVPTGTAIAAAVDCAAWWSLVKGTGPGRFDPNTDINRAQVATLIANQLRLAGRLPVSTRDHFADDNDSPHQANINALAEVGILAGPRPGVFAPLRGLSRDQMASILVRVQEHLLGQALPTPGVPFTDVADSVHLSAIQKAYGSGLTTGITSTRYVPSGTVPRRNMAAFLVRAVDKLLAASVVQRPGT